jgi:PAS domain S-box-containing protein
MTTRARPADFDAGRMAVLEDIARGAPLAAVLEAIVRLVERRRAGLKCSLLLLDRAAGCVRHGAAPSLPPAYVAAIDGQKIGPTAGSCGAAAFHGRRVIVEDIATHANWAAYRDAALPFGLRACWSSPIFAPGGEVLGTFAIYYDAPHRPAPEEIRWVDGATGLAAIAIQAWTQRDTIRKQAALLDKTSDAILLRELDGTIRYYSDGAARLYGWARAEALGRNARQLLETDQTSVSRAERDLLLRGHWAGEMRQRTKAGRELVVDSRWTLVLGEDGRPQSVLVINADVTAKKKLEAQVVASQRLESLGTLAGGIAHEFNNVLTAIMGNTGLAKRQLPADHPVQQRLEVIRAASTRAADLVRQILTFSRRTEVQRRRGKLGDVVRDAVALLQASLPPMIAVDVAIAADELEVLASAEQIRQVVLNLGTNALQALVSHGSLHVRYERLELDAPLAGVASEIAAGPCMRLTVRDDGVGMDAATLERIFEPFFSRRPTGAGAGLGLAVVHGIIKDHDGAVTVTSELGRGTTVAIYLPGAATAAASPRAATERPMPRGRGECILCVDDEEAVLALMTSLLESLDYTPLAFTEPQRAVQAFKATPSLFAAVVTDYAMHGLTGTELAREVRRLRPELPVVLTSGYLRPEETAAARAAGVQEVLRKPEFLDELPPLLDRLLHAGTARDAPT